MQDQQGEQIQRGEQVHQDHQNHQDQQAQHANNGDGSARERWRWLTARTKEMALWRQQLRAELIEVLDENRGLNKDDCKKFNGRDCVTVPSYYKRPKTISMTQEELLSDVTQNEWVHAEISVTANRARPEHVVYMDGENVAVSLNHKTFGDTLEWIANSLRDAMNKQVDKRNTYQPNVEDELLKLQNLKKLRSQGDRVFERSRNLDSATSDHAMFGDAPSGSTSAEATTSAAQAEAPTSAAGPTTVDNPTISRKDLKRDNKAKKSQPLNFDATIVVTNSQQKGGAMSRPRLTQSNTKFVIYQKAADITEWENAGRPPCTCMQIDHPRLSVVVVTVKPGEGEHDDLLMMSAAAVRLRLYPNTAVWVVTGDKNAWAYFRMCEWCPPPGLQHLIEVDFAKGWEPSRTQFLRIFHPTKCAKGDNQNNLQIMFPDHVPRRATRGGSHHARVASALSIAAFAVTFAFAMLG